MRKKVLFRVDSSSSIGLGHIKRDLVYATRFPEKEISFATQELPGNIIHEIPYPVHVLKSNNVDQLIELCNTLKIDQLIIDNYALSYEDEKKIKECCALELSVFDDTYEKHYCDEVINRNLGASLKKYANCIPSFAKVSLISPLIRKEFIAEKMHRRKKEGIFLSLGGSDSRNLTLSALKALKKHKTKVTVAITSSNPKLKVLKAYANVNRWINLYIDADISILLNRSKLAITTPSVLASEAIFMNLPVVSVKTAQNQNEVERFLKKQRFTTLSASQIHKLRQKTYLQNCRLYKKYFEPIKSNSIIMKTAGINDLMDLFELANDPLVRQNSFSLDPILLDTHTLWLKNVLEDKNALLYTFRSPSNSLVSQIRFNKTDKKSIISISISKNFRAKGLGKNMISLACQTYSQTHAGTIIEAQIKEENISSAKSFEQAGFILQKKENGVLYYQYGEDNA